MIHQPKYSSRVSGIVYKSILQNSKTSNLVHDGSIKLANPQKTTSSRLISDHGPVDANVVVPLPRMADSHPNRAIFAPFHEWHVSTRCAISGQRVYWKPGFAPGLGRYNILGQGARFESESHKIIMLSHIYDFWKAGLLAIHPDTLRVRCFVPSDVIRDYDDKAASFPDSVIPGLDALRKHYEICVWVNTTAFLPHIPLTLLSTSSEESMFHEVPVLLSAARFGPRPSCKLLQNYTRRFRLYFLWQRCSCERPAQADE
ncbi:hypothetical protein KVR01_004345 [Diaporthe batatas]|uniref:uncharacterized protein n=1 Tax=Diaporthe batatas TaxID=748121 RepID=UPI001D04C5C2|nr:uncharacterized protein KVR01_004345 [Diaporthe batatas]KAG8165793.1 hypothetical protein KVR01_004345 [Diaporthe batatas]